MRDMMNTPRTVNSETLNAVRVACDKLRYIAEHHDAPQLAAKCLVMRTLLMESFTAEALNRWFRGLPPDDGHSAAPELAAVGVAGLGPDVQ